MRCMQPAFPSNIYDNLHISPLRNISILPILLPLHIILLDQPIDIPLDVRHGQHALLIVALITSLTNS